MLAGRRASLVHAARRRLSGSVRIPGPYIRLLVIVDNGVVGSASLPAMRDLGSDATFDSTAISKADVAEFETFLGELRRLVSVLTPARDDFGGVVAVARRARPAVYRLAEHGYPGAGAWARRIQRLMSAWEGQRAR